MFEKHFFDHTFNNACSFGAGVYRVMNVINRRQRMDDFVDSILD